MAYFVVDRLEGRIAVVVGDDGSLHDVHKSRLPSGASEGSVLSVSSDTNGRLDWSHARLDEAERDRRLKEVEQRIDRVRSLDPGGDLDL